MKNKKAINFTLNNLIYLDGKFQKILGIKQGNNFIEFYLKNESIIFEKNQNLYFK